MYNLDIEKKFEKIVSSPEIKSLESITIFQSDKNTYDVFDKFKINKKSKNDILVSFKNNEEIHSFSSMKHAICYCIFERRGRYVEAKRIIQIDSLLSGLDVHIEIHKKMFKKSKTLEDKLIYLAKLNDDKHKKQNILSELEGYLTESNYWQRSQLKLKTEYYRQN